MVGGARQAALRRRSGTARFAHRARTTTPVIAAIRSMRLAAGTCRRSATGVRVASGGHVGAILSRRSIQRLRALQFAINPRILKQNAESQQVGNAIKSSRCDFRMRPPVSNYNPMKCCSRCRSLGVPSMLGYRSALLND